MSEACLSYDELKILRGTLTSRKNPIGEQLRKRLPRIEREIDADPNSSYFLSKESIPNRLCEQQGMTPVKIAQWWRDQHDQSSGDKPTIDQVISYLEKYTQTQKAAQNKGEFQPFHFTDKTKENVDNWEYFNKVCGEDGVKELRKMEDEIGLEPYSETFDSVEKLTNDPDIFPRYEFFNERNSSATSKGLDYIIYYAQRERALRDSIKAKRRKLETDIAEKFRSEYENTTKFPESLESQQERFLEKLTAEIVIDPFRKEFLSQDGINVYVNQSIAQHFPSESPHNVELAEDISTYMGSVAEEQCTNQTRCRELAVVLENPNPEEEDEMTRNGREFRKRFGHSGAQTLRWLERSANLDPSNEMFSHKDTPELRKRFAKHTDSEQGREYIVDYARKQRGLGVDSGITGPATVPAVNDNDEMKLFTKMVGSGDVGRGGQGTDFLRRIRKYMNSSKFDETLFEDRDRVKESFTSGKWKLLATIGQDDPALSEKLIDYIYQLGQEQKEARQAISDTLTFEQRELRDLIKFNQFQVDFRSQVKGRGIGRKGGVQLESLRKHIRGVHDDYQKSIEMNETSQTAQDPSNARKQLETLKSYTTEQGLTNLLEKGNWKGFRHLRQDDSTLKFVKPFLWYGNYYAKQISAGKTDDELSLKAPELKVLKERFERSKQDGFASMDDSAQVSVHEDDQNVTGISTSSGKRKRTASSQGSSHGSDTADERHDDVFNPLEFSEEIPHIEIDEQADSDLDEIDPPTTLIRFDDSAPTGTSVSESELRAKNHRFLLFGVKPRQDAESTEQQAFQGDQIADSELEHGGSETIFPTSPDVNPVVNSPEARRTGQRLFPGIGSTSGSYD